MTWLPYQLANAMFAQSFIIDMCMLVNKESHHALGSYTHYTSANGSAIFYQLQDINHSVTASDMTISSVFWQNQLSQNIPLFRRAYERFMVF